MLSGRVRLPEYDRLDALALGALVAAREVSAAELLEAALERADARNPRINAIVARFDDEARRRAAGPLPPGPLSGVPFLLKDLLAYWRGHPSTGSTPLLDGWAPDVDSEVVRRLLAAGLVVFGRTNTPELGILAVTESRMRGPARNPWDLDRTPGGSSGGSAAAIASRIVPAAHGNDGGGSIRIPSSACGLFGLKPSRGRVSLGPAFGEISGGFVTEGVLTRSVRDAAAFLDVLAGPAPGDPYLVPPPARPFGAEVGAPPGRLRIAFTTRSLFGRTTHPECRAAVEGAARRLADLGHEVVEGCPSFDRDELVRAYLVFLAATTAADVRLAAARTGRHPGRRTLEPETRSLLAAGRLLRAEELIAARYTMERAARGIAAFFATHDLLLTATLAHPPQRIGALATTRLERLGIEGFERFPTRGMLDRLFDSIAGRSFEATGNTMLFNETGQPAASVPLHWTAEGLPVGVQLVGRMGEEAMLLRVAAQVEAAHPWAQRLPPDLA
jgi:amidase